MHLAYIHQHFATRKAASGTRSYEMSRCMIEAGHRVSMICGVNDATQEALAPSGRVSESDVDGIRVYCVAEPYANQMSFARRIWSFGSFARTAARIVAGLDADVVFATSTPLTVGIPGMKGAKRLGVPFVFEVRDLWPEVPIAIGVLKTKPLLRYAHHRPIIWYAHHLERKIYFAAKHIIALAPGMKEGVCRTGYPADHVTLIPNGCDLDLFKPDDRPLEDDRFGPADEFRLLFCGSHGLANGLDAVLDAAVELKRRGEKGVRLVFVGQGGQRDRLIQRSREEGTQDMITWLTFMPKEELAALMPRMGAGMMILKNLPAFYYGTSPNKFFDYIASGIPVLNNYPGWVAGMIDENRCGMVVPPDDPRAFADAVAWMRDHRDEARAMGLRGRAMAEANFDRQDLGARFVGVMERVYAEARGRQAAPVPVGSP